MKINRKQLPIAMLLVAVAMLAALLATLGTVAGPVQAGAVVIPEDETLVPANNFLRNVSKTPDLPSEAAAMSVMPIYVPAQTPDGTSVVISYTNEAGMRIDIDHYHAKPLLVTYIDGIDDGGGGGHISASALSSGASFGRHDAFAAVSFDDGTTWKRTNLSRSADKSSFRLRDHTEYPGDVIKPAHKIVDDKILVVWTSKFCMSGTPAYAITETVTLASGDIVTPAEMDIFGVAGSQRSVDYSDEFPDVGEIPYSCVWAGRGTLEPVLDDSGQPVLNDAGEPTYTILWRKAERLTSGVRDANLVSVAGAKNAGFMITWQEDPDGLRPGEGEGPGAGWSGATVHHKTDIWYSHIVWDDFATLPDDTDADDDQSNRPPAVVPMSVPVRLTDNNSCKLSQDDTEDPNDAHQYCFDDLYVDSESFAGMTENTSYDLCATQLDDEETCVTKDGRVLDGNTGASRARIALQPYTTTVGTASAWAIIGYEESKGLGDCDDEEQIPGSGNEGGVPEEKIDEGKHVMYHSFDFQTPDLAHPGYILNSIPLSPTTNLAETIVVTEGNNSVTIYDTEIARRFGLLTQSGAKMGESDTSQILIYKQGSIKQGGPADIFAVRFVVPDGFDPTIHNPYAYSYRACNSWSNDSVNGYDYYKNPMYYEESMVVDGDVEPPWATGVPLCLAFGVELDDAGAVETTVGALNMSAVTSTTVDYTSSVTETKLVSWTQSAENLSDQTWENPVTVAKGHRGFIDGDFIMLMYAWSPNWNANKVGHDNYNLYIRRSFDGGLNWTTTPAEGDYGGNGTTTCEWYGPVGSEEMVCTDYAAGEFEPARNVSQLVGTRETILDPRYSPTPASVKQDDGTFLYEDDERDPSTFFIVYETGDNSTVAEGEAVPLDLFYSRAYNWGDDYVTITKTVTVDDADEEVDVWDALEKKDDESGEASVRAAPNGSRFYAVWNQQLEVDHEVFEDSDVMFRRVSFYLADEVDVTSAVTMLEDDVFTFDRDSGSGIFVTTGKGRVDVTLAVNDGTLSLGSLADITLTDGDGVDDTIISFYGKPSAVNTALKGMSFRPNHNFNGHVALDIRAGFSDEPVAEVSASLLVDENVDENVLNDNVDITVLPVNDAPVARDDYDSVMEDGSVVIHVCANDSDVDQDKLIVAEVSWPENGSVQFVDDLITYSPKADFAGIDSFDYRIDDNNGGSDTASVSVVVAATADAPIVADDFYHTIENMLLAADAVAGVLHNDGDSDGDQLQVSLADDVLHGALSLNPDGSFTYMPAAGYVGNDSFTYYVSDGQFLSLLGTVTIAVEDSGTDGSGDPGGDDGGDDDGSDPGGDDDGDDDGSDPGGDDDGDDDGSDPGGDDGGDDDGSDPGGDDGGDDDGSDPGGDERLYLPVISGQ